MDVGKWDVFIAYTTPDREKAKNIYDLLSDNHIRVFIDSEHLPAGTFDNQLLEEQCSSKITLALVSENTYQSYYAREEIAIAIQLENKYPGEHILLPLYLGGRPDDPRKILYGLHLRAYFGSENLLSEIFNIIKVNPNGDAANPEKQNIKYKHELHQFPRGPLVEGHLIQISVITSIAKTIKPEEAGEFLSQINRFRLEADNDSRVRIIQQSDLPNINVVGSHSYWSSVIREARLQGPRMLAAVFLTILYLKDPELFPKNILGEIRSILDKIKTSEI